MTRTAVPTIVVVLALGLVGLLVYGVVAGSPDTSIDDAVKSGDRPDAPSMELPVLGGEAGATRSIDDLRGQVVVLNFWASWCAPCKSEAPILEQAHQRLQESGAGTVLGVTFQDTIEDSQDFLREFDLTYPNVRDVGQRYAHELGTRALPETFVIDPEGRIVAISRGEVSEQFIDRAIAEARS